jgi:integrase/recombinase XerD
MKDKVLSNELFFSKTRDYLDIYLVKQCSKSHHTVKAYRDALTVFRRYVLDIKGLSIMKFKFSDCTREFVLDFICYLKENESAQTTCNQRLSAIKAYLWFVSDGDITLQPIALSVSRVPFLKEPKLNRDIISESALTALLVAPPETKTGIRDRTIMILLYDSAIRLEELLALKLSDINIQGTNPYIRIHGKGDKERIVAITDKTVGHLKLYMKYYHVSADTREKPLFYTVIKNQTNVMSPGNVERIINKFADIIREKHPELPKRVHPHMFRRTRATNLYQSGVELELISRVLGHSSTQTTRIYATPSLEMLRNAMECGNVEYPAEKPLWPEDEGEIARLCGLR